MAGAPSIAPMKPISRRGNQTCNPSRASWPLTATCKRGCEQIDAGLERNTSGLLRQYLPKKADLSCYSQSQLDEIALRLN